MFNDSFAFLTMSSFARAALSKALVASATRSAPRVAARALSQRLTSVRSMSTMDDLKSGTSAYMDLYPEQSTDGGEFVRSFSKIFHLLTWSIPC